jgi:hypothetical protein
VTLRRLRGGALGRYLRAAQAYMLISMPTDTSTILGVFQAILALLGEKNRTNSLHVTGADVDQASAAVLTIRQ